ncbi:MAG: hypothetical protein ACHP65_01705 [Legionellales bacterium]
MPEEITKKVIATLTSRDLKHNGVNILIEVCKGQHELLDDVLAKIDSMKLSSSELGVILTDVRVLTTLEEDNSSSFEATTVMISAMLDKSDMSDTDIRKVLQLVSKVSNQDKEKILRPYTFITEGYRASTNFIMAFTSPLETATNQLSPNQFDVLLDFIKQLPVSVQVRVLGDNRYDHLGSSLAEMSTVARGRLIRILEIVSNWDTPDQLKFYHAHMKDPTRLEGNDISLIHLTKWRSSINKGYINSPEFIKDIEAMENKEHARLLLQSKLMIQLAVLEGNVEQHLVALDDKVVELEREMGGSQAICPQRTRDLKALITELISSYETYKTSNRSPKEIQAFTNVWSKKLADPEMRSQLKAHRGDKEKWAIAAQVLTILPLLVLAARQLWAFFKKQEYDFFYHPKTDTENRLDALQSVITNAEKIKWLAVANASDIKSQPSNGEDNKIESSSSEISTSDNPTKNFRT